jgi:hypothetical protein
MTVCNTCDRTWTGLDQCHCTGCHRHFVGLKAFDTHWRGGRDRRCVDPLSLRREDGNPLMVREERALGAIYTMWQASRHGPGAPSRVNAEREDPAEGDDMEEVA